MADVASSTEPLLQPLTHAHRAALELVGSALAATGQWPVYQYVDAKMDDLNLDAATVLNTMPFMQGHGSLVYPLVRRDRTGRDDEPVKLTVAGLAHLDQFTSMVDMFLRVLNELGNRRAKAPYEPHKVIVVEVSGPQLVKDLQIENEPLIELLPDLLQGEPSTYHGAGNSNEHGWIHRPSSFLRRFRSVETVEDYLTRLRAWITPVSSVSEPVLASPLSLVSAFGYLDDVWRLRFGSPLVHVPSAERAARLAFDANTADEFDNRLSALGEMLKGFNVPGNGKQGSLQRLGAFLAAELPAEAATRVDKAIGTLYSATHLRNAGQHVAASGKAVTALRSLGLSFPISDYTRAWQIIQVHVVDALNALRDEIHTTIPAGQ